jgi:hypothetical protein
VAFTAVEIFALPPAAAHSAKPVDIPSAAVFPDLHTLYYYDERI